MKHLSVDAAKAEYQAMISQGVPTPDISDYAGTMDTMDKIAADKVRMAALIRFIDRDRRARGPSSQGINAKFFEQDNQRAHENMLRAADQLFAARKLAVQRDRLGASLKKTEIETELTSSTRPHQDQPSFNIISQVRNFLTRRAQDAKKHSVSVLSSFSSAVEVGREIVASLHRAEAPNQPMRPLARAYPEYEPRVINEKTIDYHHKKSGEKMFCDTGSRIDLMNFDQSAVNAALIHAHHKYGEKGFYVKGPRAEEIARFAFEHGMANRIKNPDLIKKIELWKVESRSNNAVKPNTEATVDKQTQHVPTEKMTSSSGKIRAKRDEVEASNTNTASPTAAVPQAFKMDLASPVAQKANAARENLVSPAVPDVVSTQTKSNKSASSVVDSTNSSYPSKNREEYENER